MEKLNSKAMHKFSFWYDGKSVFSTFFTNFPAMSRVLFNPSALFPTAWPVPVSLHQEPECQAVPRVDIKREWVACKTDGCGSGECREVPSQVGFWFRAFWFEGWDFPKGHWRFDFPKALPSRNGFLQTSPFNAGKCINSSDKSGCRQSLGKSVVGSPLCLAGVGNEMSRRPEVEKWRETRALVSDEPFLYLSTKDMTNELF